MTQKYFTGKAAVLPRIATFQVTLYDGTTTYTATIGDYSVSVLGSDEGTADAVATAMAAAIQAATHAHAAQVDAAAVTDTVTCTAQADASPFELSTSVSGGTGTIGAEVETQAATGPEFWDSTANWSDGIVPISADDVEIGDLATPILWNLDQNAVELGTLRVSMTALGNIGLDPARFETLAAGTAGISTAREYRNHRLRVGADRIELGTPGISGTGAGAARIAIENTQAGATTMRVLNGASTPARAGVPVYDVKLTDASADLIVERAPGGVGICLTKPFEVGQCDVSITGTESSTRVLTGAGVTVLNWQQEGGTNTLRPAATVTSAKVNGGQLTLEGSITVTTLDVDNGEVVANNTAATALTTANIKAGGVLIGTASTDARTWATVDLAKGGVLRVSDAVTITNLTRPAAAHAVTVLDA